MGRYERRVLLGAAVGAVCALGLLLLLGFRTARPPRLVRPPQPPGPVGRTPPPGPAGPLAGVVVVLDPGHGGQDPGALCGETSEAALTYRTATEVAASLRDCGARVVYTVRSRQLDPALTLTEPPLTRPADAVLAATGRPLRSRSSARPLWERAETARTVWAHRSRWDPDARRNVFFVSLHYDAFSDAAVSGSVVCVDRRVRRLPALGAALASQMARGSFGRNCNYRGVRGVSGHELGVLNPEQNPVPERVLLELATLSNPQDALEAADPVWRTGMAHRITDAIILVHQESRARKDLAGV